MIGEQCARSTFRNFTAGSKFLGRARGVASLLRLWRLRSLRARATNSRFAPSAHYWRGLRFGPQLLLNPETMVVAGRFLRYIVSLDPAPRAFR